MTDNGKLAIYQTDNYLLGLGGLSGREGLLHLLELVGMAANSTTSVLSNLKFPGIQIMRAFSKQISILLSCSATSMMFYTLEWGAV